MGYRWFAGREFFGRTFWMGISRGGAEDAEREWREGSSRRTRSFRMQVGGLRSGWSGEVSCGLEEGS